MWWIRALASATLAVALTGCGMFGGSPEDDPDYDRRNLSEAADFYGEATSSGQDLLYRRTANYTYEVFVKRGNKQSANFDRFAQQEADLTMRRVCDVPNLTYISAPIPRGDDARIFLVKCSVSSSQSGGISKREYRENIIVD